VLPWEPGTERLVWRGREHFARGNGGVGLYAYDFEMPIGTGLVAVRSGEVVALREEFKDGNGEDLKENFLMIKHDDGTIARYIHLTHNGVLVKKDDRVKQGQVIALSGNTGDTGGGAHPPLRRATVRAQPTTELQPTSLRTDAAGHFPQYAAASLRPRVERALSSGEVDLRPCSTKHESQSRSRVGRPGCMWKANRYKSPAGRGLRR
jgi:murein DD-endopeptidase MepM/ murein hydrolase activator NlpD